MKNDKDRSFAKQALDTATDGLGGVVGALKTGIDEVVETCYPQSGLGVVVAVVAPLPYMALRGVERGMEAVIGKKATDYILYPIPSLWNDVTGISAIKAAVRKTPSPLVRNEGEGAESGERKVA